MNPAQSKSLKFARLGLSSAIASPLIREAEERAPDIAQELER